MPDRPQVNPSLKPGEEPDQFLTVECEGKEEGCMCRVALWKKGYGEVESMRMPYSHWCAMVEWWQINMWVYGPDGVPEGDEDETDQPSPTAAAEEAVSSREVSGGGTRRPSRGDQGLR